MKVLWVTGWYPNKTEPFAGDFVQRHAQAVSRYCTVDVLFVVRDAEKAVTDSFHVEEFVNGSLKEKIIYYNVNSKWPSPLSRWCSYRIYVKVLKEHIRRYIAENGKPDLVHIYIGMRLGEIALWLKEELNIPYVVSEQWTGFLNEAEPSFKQLPFYFKRRWKKMIHYSGGISAVSHYLGQAIKAIANTDRLVSVIPNVVNTEIFFRNDSPRNNYVCRFVHISGDIYQKNSDDIIRAFAMVKERGVHFELVIFGPEFSALKKLADLLNVPVAFNKEVPQPELAAHMRKSDALILYSRYETFGCVLIEANACGLPVIVSDIPILNEIITDGKNGVKVKMNDPELLANAIVEFVKTKGAYNSSEIEKDAVRKYNYASVGALFIDWYTTSVKRK